MTDTKVIFIGNTIAGDDGIGPLIYEKLRFDKELNGYELIKAETIGIDIVSMLEGCKSAIIIDAVHSDKEPGKVRNIDKNQLSAKSAVSAHDLGVEHTLALIAELHPNININLIGITIKKPEVFHQGLSEELKRALPRITKDVKLLILKS